MKETRGLPSGAIADIETYGSPIDSYGTVIHWGERIPDYELRKKIAEAHQIPESELAQSTGFDMIYHQADNISREDAVRDELHVAELVVDSTLKAKNWKPEDVDVFRVASSIPVIDQPGIPNYAREVARRTGMRDDVDRHNIYAACSSGAHALISTLANPDHQGKKVLIVGVDGTTALTPDFDPDRSDHLSQQVFSNGAAGVVFVPGENITLRSEHHHEIKPDTWKVLAAHMSYEHLLDPQNPDIWQETEEASIIRVPTPEDEKLIRMRGRATTSFFVEHGHALIEKVYNDHISKFPGSKISHIIAHHASRGINGLLEKRLNKQGLKITIPWVVNDGNSSAATTLIAMVRLLEMAEPGTRTMVAGYGAGASFNGAVLEYG